MCLELQIKEMKIELLLSNELKHDQVIALDREISTLPPQTGSLELAQKALSLAAAMAQGSSDALQRMIVTHLLNLFHTQLNLVGVKNVSPQLVQQLFEQLTKVVPTSVTMSPAEACLARLSTRADPDYGIEFGPFDPRFLNAIVFSITGAFAAVSWFHILSSYFRCYLGVI